MPEFCTGCGVFAGEHSLCGACWARAYPPVLCSNGCGRSAVLGICTACVIEALEHDVVLVASTGCQVVEVPSCQNCKFRTRVGPSQVECTLTDPHAGVEVPKSGPAPRWCPIRSKGVLFKLAPDAEEPAIPEPMAGSLWEWLLTGFDGS